MTTDMVGPRSDPLNTNAVGLINLRCMDLRSISTHHVYRSWLAELIPKFMALSG